MLNEFIWRLGNFSLIVTLVLYNIISYSALTDCLYFGDLISENLGREQWRLDSLMSVIPDGGFDSAQRETFVEYPCPREITHYPLCERGQSQTVSNLDKQSGRAIMLQREELLTKPLCSFRKPRTLGVGGK